MPPVTIRDVLEQEEGRVNHLYYLAGVPHIGIGHNLRDKPLALPLAARVTADDGTVDAIFEQDLAEVEADVDALEWTKTLDTVRRGALVDLAFNCGDHGWLRFVNFLAAMKAGDWATAARELLASKAAAQNPARYRRMAQRVTSGAW